MVDHRKSVLISAALLARVDAIRENSTRERWIERAIEQRLRRVQRHPDAPQHMCGIALANGTEWCPRTVGHDGACGF